MEKQAREKEMISGIIEKIKESGYGKVVNISLPLVVSMASTTVMEFTDRVFLGNYSMDALAAALPAGIIVFLFMSFFMGTTEYVNVFIAQYTGAGAESRVGAALWQGIYFSILAGLCMILISMTAGPLFQAIGHSPEIMRLETLYFRILGLGSFIHLLGIAFSCFYSGRGITRPVMVVHMAGALFNIPLDYALINGVWIFPQWGIKGAAVATVCSWTLTTLLMAKIVFSRENNKRFKVWSERSFDSELFKRLVKFGMPGGVHFFADLLAFSFFIIMVGRVGTTELAVTNMVISLESLVFLPMMGFSIGTSILVGQALGENRVDLAKETARYTIHIALGYTLFMTLFFLFMPEPILGIFKAKIMSPEEFAPIMSTGVILLRFVVFYLLFASLGMVFIGVLKGAGDTWFVMWSICAGAFFIVVVPVYIGVTYFDAGLYYVWSFFTGYIAILCVTAFFRYRSGKWQSMRVIENNQ